MRLRTLPVKETMQRPFTTASGALLVALADQPRRYQDAAS
jgi:acyl-coenzyme A thioesterase PaaI-like protein